MLQNDPPSRPTAATLLNTFAMHHVVPKTQFNQSSSSESLLIMPFEVDPPEIAYLPIFRKLSASEPTFSAAPGVIDQHEWLVFFTIVNMSNTRLATESCDADREHSRVTLWDASSGKSIWQRQYRWSAARQRARPTFSSDGKYFGVHHDDNSVEIFVAQSATLVNTVSGQFAEGNGRITAIAVSRNGKGVAVAMDRGSVDIQTPDARDHDAAMLNEPGRYVESTLGSNVDVVQTHAVSDVCLAYDPRGRYLFLIGNSVTRDEAGDYIPVGLCWDTISRSEPIRFPPLQPGISHWATPLYNMPASSLSVFRGFYSNAEFHLGVFSSTQYSRTCLVFESYGACGFTPQALLILGNEEHFDIWDVKRRMWIRKHDRSPKDRSDGSLYKYLLKCEGKGLEKREAKMDANFVAKIAWDNMPPIEEVKGLAETEVGLTLILERENFIFLGKDLDVS